MGKVKEMYMDMQSTDRLEELAASIAVGEYKLTLMEKITELMRETELTVEGNNQLKLLNKVMDLIK